VVQGGGEEILAASTDRRSSMCPSGMKSQSRELSPKRIKKKKKNSLSPYKSGSLKKNRGTDHDMVMVVDMFSRSSESITKRN
jgi:hypothetical protein